MGGIVAPRARNAGGERLDVTDTRRRLPSVNALVDEAEHAGLTQFAPRSVVVDAVREVLDAARKDRRGEPANGWLAAVRAAVEHRMRPALRRVVNATGVVLHTNLGRAPLAALARQAVQDALGYATLEYDLDTGDRGSRGRPVADLLCELTCAEAATVATNAAAALLLVLNTLADGAETIVSRGELIEIGGSFRLPEILGKSGSVLVEVGTTNRTRVRDYALAISPRTRAILKVHRSNFRMQGFVEETPLEQLAGLGRERDIPVVHDVGSGLLIPLDRWGLTGEPLVGDSARAGAVVVCSGDKLVGGPQAGLVVGPCAVVERVAQNPLARAVRPDKVTLAALEATLRLYRDPDLAVREIPVLQMLTADLGRLRARAHRLAAALPGSSVHDGRSVVGGGAFPDAVLPSAVVRVPAARPEALVAALRAYDPPVIARIEDDGIVFDSRTIADDEIEIVVAAVHGAQSPSPPSPRWRDS